MVFCHVHLGTQYTIDYQYAMRYTMSCRQLSRQSFKGETMSKQTLTSVVSDVEVTPESQMVESLCGEYLQIKGQIDTLDKRCKEIRSLIKPSVEHNDGRFEVGIFRALVINSTRESFSLKAAKAKLTDAVLAKLAPFIKVSETCTVRIDIDKKKVVQ